MMKNNDNRGSFGFVQDDRDVAAWERGNLENAVRCNKAILCGDGLVGILSECVRTIARGLVLPLSG